MKISYYSGSESEHVAEFQKERDRIRRVSQIAREERRLTLTSPMLSPLTDHIAERDDEDDTDSNNQDQWTAAVNQLRTRSAVNITPKISTAETEASSIPPSATSDQTNFFSFVSKLTPEEALRKRSTSKRVTLNVGGQRHEVLWSTLERIPNTRLGRLRHCLTHDSILSLCDDYDIVNNEYFFDRHPTAFSSIIDFYRTGKLHLLDDVCILSYSDELEFWGIEEFYLEQCCLTKFNQRRDHLLEEMRKDKECLHQETDEEFGEGKYNKLRKFTWKLLEKPNSSKAAKVFNLHVMHLLIDSTVN